MKAKREDYAIGEIREYTTREGAMALADRIRHYWHMRGHLVRTELEWFDMYSKRDSKNGFWCVRTDMMNGLPAKQGRNLREAR